MKTVEEMQNPPEPGPVKSGIEELIEKFGTEKVGPRKMILVVMNCALTFRYPESVADVEEFTPKAIEFLQLIQKGIRQRKEGKPSLPPVWYEAIDVRDSEIEDLDIITAYAIHYWSHTSNPITEVQALTITRKNPALASELVNKIDRELKNGAFSTMIGGITEAKKT